MSFFIVLAICDKNIVFAYIEVFNPNSSFNLEKCTIYVIHCNYCKIDANFG